MSPSNVVPGTDCNSWDLPDDVFDAKAGEVKPSKPVKKIAKPVKADAKSGVRRSINEVEVTSVNPGFPWLLY